MTIKKGHDQRSPENTFAPKYNAEKNAFTPASRWLDCVDNGLRFGAYGNFLQITWITITAKWKGRKDD